MYKIKRHRTNFSSMNNIPTEWCAPSDVSDLESEIDRLKAENEDLRCCGNCGNEEFDFAFHFECKFQDKCKLYLENQKESYWIRGE